MSSKAERKLAAMVLLKFDIEVDPEVLGAFIREEWARIAPLAHLVHGRDKGVQDGAKPDPGMQSNTNGVGASK